MPKEFARCFDIMKVIRVCLAKYYRRPGGSIAAEQAMSFLPAPKDIYQFVLLYGRYEIFENTRNKQCTACPLQTSHKTELSFHDT